MVSHGLGGADIGKARQGLMTVQIVLAALVSLVWMIVADQLDAVSFFSGGCLVALNSWGLFRSVSSSADDGQISARMYRSAAARFVFMGGCLLFFGWLGLNLMLLAFGMFVSYVGGYVFFVKMISGSMQELGRRE